MSSPLLTTQADLLKKWPARAAVRWNILPLVRQPDGNVLVAILSTTLADALENASVVLGGSLKTEIWPEEQFKSAIEKTYGLGAETLDSIPEIPAEVNNKDHDPSSEAAMVRFVNDLIRQAAKEQATDIHIESFEKDIAVRFRIDGLLHRVQIPPALFRYQSLLISRIKVMARMNIAEKRKPQDGRLRWRSGAEELDVRVSTIPVLHGESVDLRLLPEEKLFRGLEHLGMPESMRETIQRVITRPNGILLTTGPTGHGKTTTLYACMAHINTPEKKIITIEDPVEYEIHGINQMQIHPKIGLTFAAGLRSVLRQDPDVIMVGEIRDSDTAEIAIRASHTGHLVFSTLHTTDSVGALVRLMDMGIEPYLISTSLQAVLAQRLVRLICRGCGGAPPCEECRNTGYRGRTALFEMFLVDDEIRGLILERAPLARIRERARAAGMKTLFEDGMAKVADGLTSRNEILRVSEEL